MRKIDSRPLPVVFVVAGVDLVRILAFVSICLILCSCSNASNGVDGPGVPSPGSTFVMDVSTDTADSGSTTNRELTVSVRVSDMLFEGKEHVVQFTADTVLVLMAYETNGDVSIYVRKEYVGVCLVDGGWLRLPFGGSQEVVDTLTGQRAQYDGEEHLCTVVWKARPEGEEKVIVQGREMTARRVRADLTLFSDSTQAGDNPSMKLDFDVWYVPELRYVVREEITSMAFREELADTLGHSSRVLTGYTLGSDSDGE